MDLGYRKMFKVAEQKFICPINVPPEDALGQAAFLIPSFQGWT